MQALTIKSDSESWRGSDERPFQNPRQAAAEWFDCGSVLDKRKKINSTLPYEPVTQGGKLDCIRNRLTEKRGAGRVCDLPDRWFRTASKMVVTELTSASLPAESSSAHASVHTLQIVQDFNERAERWRRETSFQSSLAAKFMHEDYQTIMAMGTPAIPLILNRLKTAHEHWFWALRHLARRDIAEGADNPVDATKAWLKWGKDKGYID